MPENDLPKSTRLSVMWKNGSKVDVLTITIPRTNDLLSDLRRALPVHPVMGDVYWRDDVFDAELFYAHHKVRNPFDSLGDSVATAFVIHDK